MYRSNLVARPLTHEAEVHMNAQTRKDAQMEENDGTRSVDRGDEGGGSEGTRAIDNETQRRLSAHLSIRHRLTQTAETT